MCIADHCQTWQYTTQLMLAIHYSAKHTAAEEWKRTQIISKCIF